MLILLMAERILGYPALLYQNLIRTDNGREKAI